MASDEDPEVRLGRAQEYYAHAVRVGDAEGADHARAEVAAAKRDVAAAHPPSAEAVQALEADIVDIRQRLADRTRPPAQRTDLEDAVEEIGELVARVADSDLTTGDTAVAAFAYSAVADRRRAAEAAQADLEGLGEPFAHELSRAEAARAGARLGLERLERFGRSSVRWRLAALGPVPGFLALLALFAFAAEVLVIQPALENLLLLSSTTAWLAALGLTGMLAALGWIIGGSTLPAWPPVRRFAALEQIGALCRLALAVALPIILGGLAANATRSIHRNDVNISVSALGVALVVVCASLSRMLARALPGVDFGQQLSEAEHRLAELEEGPLEVLRVYVARANALMAKAREHDALVVREAVARMPQAAETIARHHVELVEPLWMQYATSELRRHQDTSVEAAKRTRTSQLA